MSDTASWYQRKIAQARGLVSPQQPQPYRAMPPAYQQQAPQGYIQQPPAYQQPQQQTYNEQAKQGQASLTTLLDVQRAVGPKLGKGGRLNPEPCPNCGANLFYANLGMARRGPPPAPHCFTCGFNGLFEQGMESSWAGP